MQVNIERMAQELGLRPDQVRLWLGIPTSLQREIRSTSTFEGIVALASRFADRHGLCGPKFEKEELEEYRQRRAELFAVYVEQFATLESFTDLNPLLTRGEEVEAAEKFCDLFKGRIDEAGDSFEKLLALKRLIPDERNFPSYQATDILKEAFRLVARKMLERATSLGEALPVFDSIKEMVPDFGFSMEYPWDFVCELIRELEDIFRIEESAARHYVSRGALAKRFSALLEARIAAAPGFAKAFGDRQRPGRPRLRASVRPPLYPGTRASGQPNPHQVRSRHLDDFLGGPKEGLSIRGLWEPA